MAPPIQSQPKHHRTRAPTRQRQTLRRIKQQQRHGSNSHSVVRMMMMKPRTILLVVVLLVVIGYVLLAGYFVYSHHHQNVGGSNHHPSSSLPSQQQQQQQQDRPPASLVNSNDPGSLSTTSGGLRKSSSQSQQRQPGTSDLSGSSSSSSSLCTFRTYPNHRLYHRHGPQPDFLLQSEYIYGQWPSLLRPLILVDGDNTEATRAQKLCVDQSSWRKEPPPQNNQTHVRSLPFADGTNPSIVSVERYRRRHQQSSLDDDDDDDPLLRVVQALSVATQQSVRYVATVGMTHSQCHWRDSPHDAQRLGINTVQSQPDTVRTVLQFLNQELQTVAETTLYLHRNARFGTSQRHGLPAIKVDGSGSNNSTEQQQQLHLLALDDARLFVHQQQLWVSYREGKMFGYDAQVLNPIHFDFQSHGGGDNNNGHDLKISATLWASETSSFCCGRNMALLEQEEPQDDDDHNQSTTNETTRTTSRPQQQQQLQSVTWVDPVTVIDVDTTPHVAKQSTRRRLQQQQQQDDHGGPLTRLETNFLHNSSTNATNHLGGNLTADIRRRRRRLAPVNRKNGKTAVAPRHSHIHGTNAFMVYLPDRQEYLGVAHFHRPNDRKRNPYARFGHHYTHAFYTIAAKSSGGGGGTNATTTTSSGGDSEQPSFRLAALSREFVLPVASSSSSSSTDDAEVIQFVSGVELVQPPQVQGDNNNKNHIPKPYLVLAYGINDCEAGVVRVDYEEVTTQWLKPVNVDHDDSRSSSSAFLQVVDLMKPLDPQTIPQ
eukprot:CAMPEP_0168840902 /NCGR_PEP_ID=MMETSP0727-20121128/6905_1 /TAXON_ID=265536 /ORGANISM="Amphiprora sp., Strain CCMP467" /LENGTH=766 /DNA_ID=CAMNT_0008894417 /DNA_START=377 /DNA_END=2677 /DNA_ORIENTATION=+